MMNVYEHIFLVVKLLPLSATATATLSGEIVREVIKRELFKAGAEPRSRGQKSLRGDVQGTISILRVKY